MVKAFAIRLEFLGLCCIEDEKSTLRLIEKDPNHGLLNKTSSEAQLSAAWVEPVFS